MPKVPEEYKEWFARLDKLFSEMDKSVKEHKEWKENHPELVKELKLNEV